MAMRVLVLAWRLSLAPSEAEVADAEAAAEAAWEAERWDEASARYAALYAETRNPVHLYAQAQSERFAGHCETALPLYRHLLDDDVLADASTVEAANANIATCEAQLPAKPEPAPAPAPKPPIDAAPDRAPEREPARPWHRDPAGGALVGVGLAMVAGGAVLLGIAPATADRARASEDDGDYGKGLERARAEIIAGSVIAGIGGALLVSGIVRWVVLAKRGQRRTGLTLGPRGIVLTGRF